MNNPRLILPLAAAVLLGAAVAVPFLLPPPEVEPSKWELPPAPVATSVVPAPTPVRPRMVRPAPVQPTPVRPAPPMEVAEEPRETVASVPVPEPEVAPAPPPEAPFEEPARPRRAWRHGNVEQ